MKGTLNRLSVSETSDSGHRVANSGAMKDNEETECKEAEQVDVEEKSKKKKKKKKRKHDNERDLNTQDIKDEQLSDKQEKSVRQSIDSKNSESPLKNQEKTECKDAGQIEVANKKKRKSQVQEDDEKDFCARTEDRKNSRSDHIATNSGAPKDTVKTGCKDAGQIEKAEKSKKKKKRKSQVQEDEDDENDSCTRSRDEERLEFRQDTESSDVVNKGIEKTKCKNDAKKKKKKRKREEYSDEAEGVLNDADDDCTEGQEWPVKKTKKSKDNGRTENKKSKKLTEKPDLSEEKDDAGDSQWQSAEFGDTAQKEKFLRLMGAYKPCNKERSPSSFSVMAMNKQQEKAFSFSLEKQFVQAMQTRKERGSGLGYQ